MVTDAATSGWYGLWVHRRGYHSEAEIRSELAGIRGLDVEASAHRP